MSPIDIDYYPHLAGWLDSYENPCRKIIGNGHLLSPSVSNLFSFYVPAASHSRYLGVYCVIPDGAIDFFRRIHIDFADTEDGCLYINYNMEFVLGFSFDSASKLDMIKRSSAIIFIDSSMEQMLFDEHKKIIPLAICGFRKEIVV